MVINTRGIVTRTVQYGETSVICDVFTEALGLQTYIINGVRRKKSRYGSSLLQPMSVLDMVAYHRDNRDINKLGEIKQAYVYQRLPFDVVKGAVGLFMIELVQKTVKESEANAALFDFLLESFTQLDEQVGSIANFHLCFMIQLSGHLGFQMDDNYSETCCYFDLQQGQFTDTRILGGNGLDRELSQALLALMQLPLAESSAVKLSREQRRTFIHRMIRYYQLQVEGFTDLNAYAVLQEIF